MPPQLQALLQNRNLLIGVGGGLALLLILIVVVSLTFGGGKKEAYDPGNEKLKKEQMTLLSDATKGKAMELQALLARNGIRTNPIPGTGGVVSLEFTEGATLNDRDKALIITVESGLMDGQTGLEAFDSANLMESREEKRIKLIRAQQGELARIIRKMNPIEDVAVRLSIPEPSIFAKDQKAMSASVQVTIEPGDRLSRDKVRAIINLMVGSVQGLDAHHVALTDTNGNTYNSVLDSGMEMQDKIEEQDRYMKEKVSAQLDKLVGTGHYVVTVSTSLREAPRETIVQSYDPSRSALTTKQRFSETLSSEGRKNVESSGGAVSSFLPPEVEEQSAEVLNGDPTGSSGSKGYVRDGVEMTYENGRTQYVESSLPGMIEDITIAVTLDVNHAPNMPTGDLQAIIARAASPKVRTENVSIARSDFAELEGAGNGKADAAIAAATAPLPEAVSPVMVWLPWMIFSLAGIAVISALLISTRRVKSSEGQLTETTQEIDALRYRSEQQQAELMEQRRQNEQMMQTQQQQFLASQQAIEQSRTQDTAQLQQTMAQLRLALQDQSKQLRPEGLEAPIKSWIES